MSFAFASGSGDNETKLQLNGGAAALQNGHCVVCDYDGKNIKLLHSYETRIKATLALKDNPWDVTAIDGCNVIITLPKVRQLKFIKVIPEMVPGRVIQLDKPCWGIQMARSVDEIYTSCYSDTQGDILVLDMEGNLKRTRSNRRRVMHVATTLLFGAQ